MSEIHINARQRRVIEIALVLAAGLLLLGLVIDATGVPGYGRQSGYRITASGLRVPTYATDASWSEFLRAVLRLPRLYITGLLVGLAVFIHRGAKDGKA